MEIGLFSMIVAILFPKQITSLYIEPSAEILTVAQKILRLYFSCLLLLPFNVYAIYYLQAVQWVKASVMISLQQSVLFCSLFLYLLLVLLGPASIWYVMLCVGICTAFVSIWLMKKE